MVLVPTQYTEIYNEINDIVTVVDPAVMSMTIEWLLSTFTSSQISSVDGLMTQASDEGITVVAASGDSGYGYAYLEMPSADPWVTAVGGVTDDLSPGIIGQWGWSYCDVSCGTASTGGAATNFPQPYYQSSEIVTVPSNGYRDVPDISFPASPAIALYYNGGWQEADGTSFAAPMFAGLVADLVSYSGFDYGALNYALYNQFYGTSYGYVPYSDVTVGYNGQTAGTGWDFVTGIGTPNAWNFVQAVYTYEVCYGGVVDGSSVEAIDLEANLQSTICRPACIGHFIDGILVLFWYSALTCPPISNIALTPIPTCLTYVPYGDTIIGILGLLLTIASTATLAVIRHSKREQEQISQLERPN